MTFNYLPLELTFVSEGLLKVPPFAGSMLRGAFGASLKQSHCLSLRPCRKTCQKGSKCVYGRVFETPMAETHDLLGKVTFAPHPFALFPVTSGPRILEAGQKLVCRWTIWGDALENTAYMILAWAQAGRRGFGINQSPAQLAEVRRLDTHEVVFAANLPNFGNLAPSVWTAEHTDGNYRVTLATMSPLRLKYQRQFVGMRSAPTAEDVSNALFTNLARRVSLFASESKVTELDGETPEVRIKWQEHTRFSRRQDTLMEMGGMEGTIRWERLNGNLLQTLRAGEILQVGKNTSMGLGKYKLEVEVL